MHVTSASVTEAMFARLDLLPPQRYIQFLYQGAAGALEHDLHMVPTDRNFHGLLDTGLLVADQRVYQSLEPVGAYRVVVVECALVPTVVDRLLALDYDPRVVPLPSVLESARLPAERQAALLLWVCRQPSIRDGLRESRERQRGAIVVPYPGGHTGGLLPRLVPPRRLAHLQIADASWLELTPFPNDTTETYAGQCRSEGVALHITRCYLRSREESS